VTSYIVHFTGEFEQDGANMEHDFARITIDGVIPYLILTLHGVKNNSKDI